VPGQDPAQELQVRQTAQRLLATHLWLPPGTSGAADQRRRPSSRQVFWPDVSLDLTGAALVDLDFKEVSAVKAWFNGATFQGSARFHGATFHDDAEFNGATFQRGAWFNGATFHGNGWYNRATFQGNAWFSKATFQDAAGFAGATFQDSAWFYGATFQDSARFHGATFQRAAWFNGATFTGDNRGEGVAGAQVLRLDDSDLNERRVWPNGWTVRPDPADPTRGTLVRAEQMEEPEPAATPPNPLSR
jgi:hypothetical protein